MIVNHEVRDEARAFSHRLVAPGRGAGAWVGFQRPACLEVKGVGTFVTVTEYWKGEMPFPEPGKVYLVKEKT